MAAGTLSQKFAHLFEARTPLIYVESSEWERIQGALQTAVALESENLNKQRRLLVKFSPVRSNAEVWDVDQQRWNSEHESVKQLANIDSILGAILWFRDDCPEPFCLLLDDFQGQGEGVLGDTQDKTVMNLLRDFVRVKKDHDVPFNDRKTIVFASEGWKFPEEISHELVTLDMELPTAEILKRTLSVVCEDFNVEFPKGELQDRIIKAALGLTVMEAEQAFSTAVVKGDYNWSASSAKIILRRKRDIIRKSGALDYIESSESMDSIGGLDILKQWLQSRTKLFSEEAKQRGIPQPKGIMLTGVPGCGKSLTAKAIGELWGIPLVRFDLASVFNSFQGASERNIREALRLAEAVSPCVLFIDEIEKGLAGSGGSGDLDSGTGKRVFGTILTWMNDQNAGVFVVATSNSLKDLPPELKRKGRFDEIFFLDLPDAVSRGEIFVIQLNEFEPEWSHSDIDIDQLAEMTDKWTGAEIKAAVNDAQISAFNDGNRPIKMVDLATYIGKSTPQAKSMGPAIEAMRAEADKIGRRAASNRGRQGKGSNQRGNTYS